MLWCIGGWYLVGCRGLPHMQPTLFSYFCFEGCEKSHWAMITRLLAASYRGCPACSPAYWLRIHRGSCRSCELRLAFSGLSVRWSWGSRVGRSEIRTRTWTHPDLLSYVLINLIGNAAAGRISSMFAASLHFLPLGSACDVKYRTWSHWSLRYNIFGHLSVGSYR